MKTRIATSDATSITVLGRDLVSEIVGHRSFTETFFFLVRRRFPEAGETAILDACLVTMMEHGLNPSVLVARLVADSVPDQAQVAIGAGVMAIGDVFAGTMEGCARLLRAGLDAPDPDAYCRTVVAEHRAARRPLPGFGHRSHKPDDPRTPRLLEVARGAGAEGRAIALIAALGRAVDAAAGRHVTINATGAVAALLLEIGFPVGAMRGTAVVARAGGLVGHLLEERETRAARHLWDLARETIPYEDP